MNIAVIGNGNMAAAHIQHICKEKGAQLYAICDANPETLSQRKEEFSDILTVSDYKKFVNDPNLDAVIIVADNAQYPAMVKAFLDAGKTVLCEKPSESQSDESTPAKKMHQAKLLLETLEDDFSPKNPLSQSQVYFSRAVAYIQANYQQEITVTKLAGVLGLTRCYFSRVFQAHAGVTPKEYIVSYRMEKALELLTANGLSQKEAALMVGYPDVSTFSRIFRRKYGMPPGKYLQVHEPIHANQHLSSMLTK